MIAYRSLGAHEQPTFTVFNPDSSTTAALGSPDATSGSGATRPVATSTYVTAMTLAAAVEREVCTRRSIHGEPGQDEEGSLALALCWRVRALSRCRAGRHHPYRTPAHVRRTGHAWAPPGGMDVALAIRSPRRQARAGRGVGPTGSVAVAATYGPITYVAPTRGGERRLVRPTPSGISAGVPPPAYSALRARERTTRRDLPARRTLRSTYSPTPPRTPGRGGGVIHGFAAVRPCFDPSPHRRRRPQRCTAGRQRPELAIGSPTHTSTSFWSPPTWPDAPRPAPS